MIYAQITDGTIIRTTGGFTSPGYGEDGEWYDFSDPDVRDAYLAEHGWHVTTEVDRPADTDTHTHDLTYELVDGQPTQVWTQREWTPEELAARTAAANDQALRDGLAAEIDRALTRQAAYQAVIDTPNSEIKANPQGHIVSLARQGKRSERALIRLTRLVGGLTDSADTGTD